jgi:hypothetical protein
MKSEQKPECFGLWYEGGLPGDGGADCRGCLLATDCLTQFLEVTLPAAEAKVKTGGKRALAKVLGVDPESVVFAQTERDRRTKANVRPIIAGSATPVVDPAIRAWGQDVTPAGSAVVRVLRVGLEWRPQYDEIRWRRERERTPAIAALTPGMVLITQYKGKEYRCKVMKRGYVFRGQLHPTLYSVTKMAVGTREAPRQRHGKNKKRPEGIRNLVPYSAAKFWHLGQYEPKRAKRRGSKKH